MTPRTVLEAAAYEEFVGPDGASFALALEPGLNEEGLAVLESTSTCRLPAELRDLLSYARGFAWPYFHSEGVDFARGFQDALADMSPCGYPLCSEEHGDLWLMDLTPEASTAVFFASHDEPAFILQARSLAEFLEETLNLARPGRDSAVRRIGLQRQWSYVPSVPVHHAIATDDLELARFAQGLGAQARVWDLRSAGVGEGFDWAQFGPGTVVRRHGYARLFATLPPARGLLKRLLGRS